MSRKTRYQAAIVQDHQILLLKVWDHTFTGKTFWLIPGGGRLPSESEEACVKREALEETSLHVAVERLILDVADVPQDHYQRSKTYLCRIIGGNPKPGVEPEVDSDEKRTIQAVGWFDLRDPSGWEPLAKNDPITHTKLQQIRTALGYSTHT